MSLLVLLMPKVIQLKKIMQYVHCNNELRYAAPDQRWFVVIALVWGRGALVIGVVLLTQDSALEFSRFVVGQVFDIKNSLGNAGGAEGLTDKLL